MRAYLSRSGSGETLAGSPGGAGWCPGPIAHTEAGAGSELPRFIKWFGLRPGAIRCVVFLSLIEAAVAAPYGRRIDHPVIPSAYDVPSCNKV